jgi:tetratricopeptide (TPR) repeat protein
MIPEYIVLTIPKDKDYLTKPEIFMLDLLSNYQWDRPLSLLSMGGDINVGLKDYLMYDGFSYRFVPVKNRMKSTEIGFADADDLYDKIKNVYTWDALKRNDYFVDYQNFYTFCRVLSQRQIFLNAAWEMLKVGDSNRAVELLDMCQECVPEENFPLDITYLGFSNEYMVIGIAEAYYAAGASEKAEELLRKMADQLFVSLEFFSGFGSYSSHELEKVCSSLEFAMQVAAEGGSKEFAEEIASLTGYRPVNDFTAPDATLDDWAALHLGIPSVNIELGKGSVLLPREQIEPIWEAIKGLWQILAEK